MEDWHSARPDLPNASIGIITRIWRLSKWLTDDRHVLMQSLGIDAAIPDLLANLRRAGVPYRMRVSGLAYRCRVSKGAITQRVARAEAEGLVRALADSRDLIDGTTLPEQDKRAVWIELTSKGKAMVDDTVETILHHAHGLLADLSDAEQKALTNSLRKLLYHLEQK